MMLFLGRADKRSHKTGSELQKFIHWRNHQGKTVLACNKWQLVLSLQLCISFPFSIFVTYDCYNLKDDDNA